jgi:flagellar basal-body rod protein FlgB
MDLNQIPLFKVISRRLGFLEERQRVLAQNIANVDTPGFKPKDVKAPDFKRLAMTELKQLETSSTNPHHIVQATANAAGQYPVERQATTYETTISGNSVDLDEQLLKVSKTTLDHQTLVNLYRKQIGLLKIALDRGGS